MQLDDVQEALSSQCSSSAAVHVRRVPADLSPGLVAVTVVASKSSSPGSTSAPSSPDSSQDCLAADTDDAAGGGGGAPLHKDQDQH